MMCILNLVCEYLTMAYTYSYVTWEPMFDDYLYIECDNMSDVADIYRQIKVYCHDLQMPMDTVTCDNKLFITLPTGEKIDISCA